MADQQALHTFAQWVAGCSGNEKQEAQTFVQKLFTAWGWEDATEAGVSFKHKIPKGGAGGGMGYADHPAELERFRQCYAEMGEAFASEAEAAFSLIAFFREALAEAIERRRASAAEGDAAGTAAAT